MNKKVKSKEAEKLIEKAIHEVFCTSSEQLHKKSRRAEITIPRDFWRYYLSSVVRDDLGQDKPMSIEKKKRSRIMYAFTLRKIGTMTQRVDSKSDHVEVLHSIKVVRNFLATDNYYREIHKQIVERLDECNLKFRKI
jgi:hypothetical protein